VTRLLNFATTKQVYLHCKQLMSQCTANTQQHSITTRFGLNQELTTNHNITVSVSLHHK